MVMSREPKTIDVTDTPEPLRLAEEVHSTHKPRLLRSAEQELALLIPVRAPGRPTTEADLAAFRSAAGGWADIDTDQLLEDFRESRRLSRPPVDV
jgi:type IV secretory pathway VirJ component